MSNKVKTTLEMYVHRHADGLDKLHAADMSEYGDHWGVCLGPVEVKCEYDAPDTDPVQAMIETLERRIDKERADSQVRINILLDRIGQLKCLPHDGGDV